MLRDQGQCTYETQSKRCPARRWLDVHHITPLSEGGRNEFDNLTTLCSAHHRMSHHVDKLETAQSQLFSP